MDNDQMFDMWMALVDSSMESIAGVVTGDIEDCGYWDMWDAGTLPYVAATIALEESGFNRFL